MENRFEISNRRLKRMHSKILNPPLNILFVGVTGAGKSSTINALLGCNAANVGEGTDPETQNTRAYKLDEYFTLWDSPGLGDSPENDARHLQIIKSMLFRPRKEFNMNCGKLIDMVIVVIDGSRRDLGMVYTLLNEVIFPFINSIRVLFVINQADMAKSGRHWDNNTSSPDENLQAFLKEQAQSVRQRIEENTGKEIRLPLCISATENFNIYALMNYIIDNLPYQRSSIPTEEQIEEFKIRDVKECVGVCKICGKDIIFPHKLLVKNPLLKTLEAHRACEKVYEIKHCVTCGKSFQITYKEKDFFISKGLSLPKRCLSCRNLKKNSNKT